MKPSDFAPAAAGECLPAPGGYWAFVPNELPPKLDLDWSLVCLLSEADRALAELSGAGQLLPNPHMLIRPYLQREAALSSLIENTVAGVDELFYFAAGEDDVRNPDVREVANHVRALEVGLQRSLEMPIGTRLICELHAILLADVRGGGPTKTPGELRRSQNWIGKPGCTLTEATFVPPPPEEMHRALGQWENYLHSTAAEPPTIQCALLHYQFEAIHPFLDGNGRIGRLLITLFLCSRGCLSQPLLYLSGFFEEHRDEYYRRLLAVSQQGDWRGWLDYFLRGVRTQAQRALADTQTLLATYEQCRATLKAGRKVPMTAARILDELFGNPVFSIARFCTATGHSHPTASKGIEFWQRAGFVHEVTGQRRHRLFVAQQLMDLMMGRSVKRAPGGEPSP